MSNEVEENREKVGSISKDNTAQTAIIVAVISGLISLFNAVVILWNNDKIQDITRQQNATNQDNLFHERLKASLNDLSSSAKKAKLTIITLYPLANNIKNKCILLMIARATEQENLSETLYQLILYEKIDPSEKCIVVEFGYRLKSYNIGDKKLQQKQTEKDDIIKNTGGQVEILSKLTPKNLSVDKWIFIGVQTSQKRLDNATIELKELPTKGGIYKVVTFVNLRSRAYSKENGLGDIVGVLGENSRIKVLDIKKVENKIKQQRIWGRIQILEKGQN